MKINQAYFILLFIFISNYCYSQNYDSLKQNIEYAIEQANDSVLTQRYLDLAFAYYNDPSSSIDSLIAQANNALVFALKSEGIKQQITAMNLTAIAYRWQAKFEESLVKYDEIIAIAEKHNKALRVAQMMDNKANVYMRMQKRDDALTLRLAALEIFKKENANRELAVCYNGIGAAYMESEEYEKAIEHFNASINYAEKKKGVSAHAYGNLAISYKKNNQIDSALVYFLKCRKESENIQYLYNDNEAHLALFYSEQDLSDEAINTYENLIDKFPPASSDYNLQYYRVLLGKAYLKKGDQGNAKNVMLQVKENELENRPIMLFDLGKLGYNIYENEGDYQRALTYYKLFRDMNDTIHDVERDSRFKQIEGKYNVAEKEKIINTQEIELKNRLLIIGGLASAFLLLFLGFYYRQKRIAYEKTIVLQKNKLQRTEIDSLKKENKLISMRSLLEGQEEERTRIARDLHDNIGTLMATIKMKILSIQDEIASFEKMNVAHELDNMINNASLEIRKISHRMTPTAMEIAGVKGAVLDLKHQLVEKNIELKTQLSGLEYIKDKNLSINIYRILQELVNNISKHSQATVASIDVSIRDNDMVLRVRDNGVGMTQDQWNNSNGIGLKNLKSRVDFLNGKIKRIEDTGTHFKITIPIEESHD